MSEGREGHAAAAHRGQVIALGGWDGQSAERHRSAERWAVLTAGQTAPSVFSPARPGSRPGSVRDPTAAGEEGQDPTVGGEAVQHGLPVDGRGEHGDSDGLPVWMAMEPMPHGRFGLCAAFCQ